MELLTCPFCGHDEPELAPVADQPGDAFAVFCQECGMHGPVDADQVSAVDKWNQRAPVLS
jgi:Lar family restriction alleviation protein